MSYGPQKVFNVFTASGASTSSLLDIGGKSYTWMSVYPVTMSTGALVTVYGAPDSTTTPAPIQNLVTNTSTVAYQKLQIPTANSGNWSTFETPPFEYLKFVTSDVVSGGVSYIVCLYD